MSRTVRARTSPGRTGRVPSAGDRHPPRSGEVLEVTREASVQFAEKMLFRVIRVHDWPTYTGWLWLDGYQLDTNGEAVERRSIFVQESGLRRVAPPPARRPRPRQRPVMTGTVPPK